MTIELHNEGASGVETPFKTAQRIYAEICQENNTLPDDVKRINDERVNKIQNEMNGELSIKGCAEMVAKSGDPYVVVDFLEHETSDASEKDKLRILALSCTNEARILTREAQWSKSETERIELNNEAEIYMKKAVYLEAGIK